ncbi:hypothetical protein MLD38_002627 [Melastoma candidum]|uniref:Uncharacterized protein n=1 Tax=Melastoma candidum TaxID=119954 RepID=A0ACB9RZP3_9MYRT|nr:hypothetical protein MLD38_002627 [Melastoma candidum]
MGSSTPGGVVQQSNLGSLFLPASSRSQTRTNGRKAPSPVENPRGRKQREMERSSMIDMPLDDIIQLTNPTRKRPRHMPPASASSTTAPLFLGSSGLGPPASHFPVPPAPYPYPGPPSVMPMSMLLPTGLSGWDPGDGTKLYVSNLDYDVSNEDIKLLFSDVGALKRYGIHCDRAGRSMGTAEVVFFRREDAVAAIRRYDNSRLDGKPLKIELVGANVVAPNYCFVEPFRTPMGVQRPMMTTHGHNHNTRQSPSQVGNGRGMVENVKPTAEALDADLEKHQSKAKRTSKLAK